MKHALLSTAIASVLIANAYADTIVTSKKYVDDHDDLKVDIAQGVGTNNANVGKTLVVNSSGNLELGTISADNFVEDSITDGVTTKAPSENAVHDALADKQDTIETGMVQEWGLTMPALISYNSADGYIKGNEYGILSQDILNDDGTYLYECAGTEACEMMIPTANAVGNAIDALMTELNLAIAWNADDTTAVNNYSTEFNGQAGDWPEGQSTEFVKGRSLARGLALKQNRQIGAAPVGNANSTDADKVLIVGNDGKITMGTPLADKQDKKTCAGWLDGTTVADATHTDANCVLWNLPD